MILVLTAVSSLASQVTRTAELLKPHLSPKPVTVPVSRGDVAQTVTAPGQLVGIQERMLGVDIDGRLLELTVRPGSIVQAGDVIARLDPTPYETALEVAQIQLARGARLPTGSRWPKRNWLSPPAKPR